MKATIAFSSTSWRHTNTMRGVSIAITLLFDEHPFGLEQRERDEPDDRCRGHDQGAWADHAHGDGDEELALGEPARLLHETLLEERNDHESAAERHRARLEEKRQELAERGAAGCVATTQHGER